MFKVSVQRISEIIKRRNKQRLAKAAAIARKEAAGDFSHLKNKKGEFIAKPLPQPTLPNVTLDDEDDHSSMRKAPPPSTYTAQNDYYYADQKDYPPNDYPPMPAYNQPYSHYPDGYNQYNPSSNTLQDDPMAYDDNDYGSTAHLNLSAQPFSQQHTAAHHGSYGAEYPPQNAGYPGGHNSSHDDAYADTELAYGDTPDYTAHSQGPLIYDAVHGYPQNQQGGEGYDFGQAI